MAAGFPVRAVIVMVVAAAIVVPIVVSIVIPCGNGGSRCRTDGAAEDSTIPATYLIANGSSNRATDTATQGGVGSVIRQSTQ
jgi:hypothetical protein